MTNRRLIVSWTIIITCMNTLAAEETMEDSPPLQLLDYLGAMLEEDDQLIGPQDFQQETPPQDAWISSEELYRD